MFTKRVAAGRKALVAGLFGGEREVMGPARVPFYSSVREFGFEVVKADHKATLFDENGHTCIIEGPESVHVHPDGSFSPHKRTVLQPEQRYLLIDEKGQTKVIGDGENDERVLHLGPEQTLQEFQLYKLAEHEALVIITEDGTRKIIKGREEDGTENSKVFVDPRERVHQFRLTGGGDEDGLCKEPGALRFAQLRLQPTQAYFAFPIRTKDHVVITIKLMIFWKIADVQKFLEQSEDPLGAMYNKMMADLTSLFESGGFDTFKVNPGERIANQFEGENADLEFYREHGIEISKVVLRGWSPDDRDIQRVLNQAAALETEKEIAEARHNQAMIELDYEKQQLERKAQNNEMREQASTAEGRILGLELRGIEQALENEESQNGRAHDVTSIVKVYAAGKAVGAGGGVLHIGNQVLE